jgi:hypothetical protein
MKKQFAILLLLALVFVSGGCSSGPFRQFFKGGACSSCNPPFGLFNRKQHTVGTCNDGVCSGVAPVDGAMIGGPEFGSGVAPATSNPPTVDSYPYPGTSGAGIGGSIVPNTEAPLPGARGR